MLNRTEPNLITKRLLTDIIPEQLADIIAEQ